MVVPRATYPRIDQNQNSTSADTEKITQKLRFSDPDRQSPETSWKQSAADEYMLSKPNKSPQTGNHDPLSKSEQHETSGRKIFSCFSKNILGVGVTLSTGSKENHYTKNPMMNTGTLFFLSKIILFRFRNFHCVKKRRTK
jgi:hypothetical protein